MLAGLGQGAVFGVGEAVAGLVQAGRIFLVGAKDEIEERRRHFVVLGVGFVGVHGDGEVAHVPGEQALAGRALGVQLAAGPGHQEADAEAGQSVGDRGALGRAGGRFREAHAGVLVGSGASLRGGRGKKGLTRA